MIRFSCEQCGHKISVQDQSVGKRGKCPKCGNVVIVPDKSTTIEFQCESCGQKISVPRIHAGRKGRCPKCKGIIIIKETRPTTPVSNQSHSEDLQIGRKYSAYDLSILNIQQKDIRRNRPVSQFDMSERTTEPEHESEEDYVNQRRLPWPIDLLLYPVSQGGLCTIGVLILLKLLTDIAKVLLACCLCVGGILGFIAQIVIVYSYIYWYFSECIRDSATGGLRAPEIIGSMPGLGDMVCQFFRLFACYAFFLGPFTFYRGYTFLYKIETDSVIFWSLLTYGIFFFPIGVLAVVMFGSINGLNPVLLIRSIFSILFRYCLLVLLFYVLGVLFVLLRFTITSIFPRSGIITSIFSTYVPFTFSIYALLVMGHLLGRFYYKHQDKLNWEV